MGNSTSRTRNVVRNAFWGIGSTVIIAIGNFVVRTVFVRYLGIDYLGVNGLFTNVLAILSFSDLGIGIAVTYALYKPIAEDNQELIASIILFFKKAYRVIAAVVCCAGLLLLPFLDLLVNTDIPMGEIRIYYLVFLFNTVSSYFIVYRSTYVSACQKNYIIVNAGTISTMLTYICQILVIILTDSFFVYLIVAAAILLAKNIAVALYLGWRFPILRAKSAFPVPEQERQTLWRNIRALVVHKFGDISVNQTDNIIVSVCISTATVGLLSNYTMLVSLIRKLTDAIYNSFAASIGNLVASEDSEKCNAVFDEFDLFGFLLNGVMFICGVTLARPFVILWLGGDYVLGDDAITLLFFAVFLELQTSTVFHFKVADGRFKEDQWVPFLQAFVNLAASVLGAYFLGLPGVFLGTILQRMIVAYVRPHIVYKYLLKRSARRYYIRFIIRAVYACIVAWGIHFVVSVMLTDLSWTSFFVTTVSVALLASVALCLPVARTAEFKKLFHRFSRMRIRR